MYYTIRRIIDQMRKISAHALYLQGCNIAVNLMYGKPDDIYCEWSFSRWKNINGKNVCRQIHCNIPKELITPEIKKYCIDKEYLNDARFKFGEFIIPERVFNGWLSGYKVDITRTISDPYYMMVDCLEMANW